MNSKILSSPNTDDCHYEEPVVQSSSNTIHVPINESTLRKSERLKLIPDKFRNY